jgi:hypothetical protein
MKKFNLAIFIFILLLASPVLALEEFVANEKTVGWDVVALVQPTDVITYNVHTKNLATDEITFIKNVSVLRATIQFTVEGKFAVGVSTVRTVADGEVVESTINWSDINGASTPNPFIIKWYAAAAPPPNLHAK